MEIRAYPLMAGRGHMLYLHERRAQNRIQKTTGNYRPTGLSIAGSFQDVIRQGAI